LPVAKKELFKKYSRQQIKVDTDNYSNECIEALKNDGESEQ
jgi:hypothetical protein